MARASWGCSLRDDALIGEFGRSDGEESKMEVARDEEKKGIRWAIGSVTVACEAVA
jgi:hypothetical protein